MCTDLNGNSITFIEVCSVYPGSFTCLSNKTVCICLLIETWKIA